MNRDEIIRRSLEASHRIPNHIKRAQDELIRISQQQRHRGFIEDQFGLNRNGVVRQQLLAEINHLQEIRSTKSHLLEQRLHYLQNSISRPGTEIIANKALGIDYQKIVAERLKEGEKLSSINARKYYEELRSPNFWRDQQREIQLRREMFESNPIIGDYGKRIHEEGLFWEKKIKDFRENEDLLFKNSVFQATNAFERNIDSLIGRNSDDLRFLRDHNLLASRISEPGIAYSQFSRRTLGRVNTTDDHLLRAVNIDALNLAETQITKATLMIDNIRESSLSSRIEPFWLPPEKPVINLFKNQRRELIDNYETVISEQSPELSDISMSAQISELTQKCFNTMIQCNKDRKLRGQEVIFKLTDSFVEASINLPFMIAENEEILGRVLDYLYMTIYEGAGSSSLRYLSSYLFGKDEIEVVMVIKSLRSKWLRHDIDHGNQRDIDKKWLDLNQSLQFIGVERFPKIKDEYIRLQLNLLNKIYEFLSLLEARVNVK